MTTPSTRTRPGPAIALWLALAAACSARAPEPAAVAVRVGIANASSDVGLFIAHKKGYFRAESLDVAFVPFDSGARMVAPLGAGQLDVGAGSPAAGLYNAVARGIPIWIVADKGSTPKGYGYQPLLVRKDLVDNGRYKSLRDLRGMKIAGSAPGSASTSTLNEALKSAGLEYGDVERVFLPFPQHVLALQNKAVDAALTTEPSATEAIQRGVAVKVMGDDEIYPDHQLAVILYGGRFIDERPDAARRFMRAYIRAVREYNDSLVGGRIAGPNADEIISILTEYTNIKDPAIYRAISAQGCNPDGTVNEASLETDLQFYRDQGHIEGSVTIEQTVDRSFVQTVLSELGPYKARERTR